MSKTAAPMSPAELEASVLKEATQVLKTQAFHMKRCLDEDQLMDALKHASNMLSELRTSLLTPKNYYALFMDASDELRHLSAYLEAGKHGKAYSELYELVQYAGNILPRLYLLITVGAVYIKSKEAPAKDVLRDLVEMCRGVQHPTRGLFLRTYLSEMTKTCLPDTGNEFEGKGGSVYDSLMFVTQNFTEMNKLWVRMQHQGPARERAKREAERKELRLLIGKNLNRITQLEGVTVDVYQEKVLPRLLEQAVNCRDRLAQQYLMESLIQVVPDEFHLQTLETLLGTCSVLQPEVDVRTIVVSLIDRLAEFAQRNPSGIPIEIDVFELFSSSIAQIVGERQSMTSIDVLKLQVSLQNVALRSYPDKIEYVDRVIGFAAQYCADVHAKNAAAPELRSDEIVSELRRLLEVPIEVYSNPLTLIELTHYPALMSNLPFAVRKEVAVAIARAALQHNTPFSTVEHVNKYFALLAPIVSGGAEGDDEAEVAEANDDEEEFAEETNLAGSLVHLFDTERLDTLFALYHTARAHFQKGGLERMKHTLVPIVFRTLLLAQRLKAAGLDDEQWEEVGKKTFEFVHQTISVLAKVESNQELSLRLFLSGARCADTCGFEIICYSFISKAFELYEEIANSHAQFAAITLVIATLQTSTVFSEENYDVLRTKSAQYSAKLLKKEDQCLAVTSVSHLFWQAASESGAKDGKRVLECLQRALKIAYSCSMDRAVAVRLYVHILNTYVAFFAQGVEEVSASHLNGLVQLIKTNIAEVEDPKDAKELTAYFDNTLDHVRAAKEADNALWEEIVIE